ncbi:hypothetical protein [Streptomyces sp. URMC 129]|uniref:hypothetical protein n=1 Tax=Streptomyces sp. URMC 129 TaxID=3423407 RepID=UPI003F1E436A
MRIRITAVTSVADGHGNRYGHGQVADLDEDLARAWLAAGHAEPATEQDQDEAPAPRPARKRTATRRAPRTGGRAKDKDGADDEAPDGT